MADNNKEKKPSFPLRIEKDLLEKGKDLADKRGISLAGLFRMLLLRELEAEEKK